MQFADKKGATAPKGLGEPSVTERNHGYLEENINKYKQSILYSNQGRVLKLGQTQIAKGSGFENMLQRQQKATLQATGESAR